jgi:hypothetical protein
MTQLDYLMEAPSCGLEDANFVAFVEATSIIGGRDAVEEFLACGLLVKSLVLEWRRKSLRCQKLWC